MNKPVNIKAYLLPPSFFVIRHAIKRDKAPQSAEAKCSDFMESPKTAVNMFKKTGVSGSISRFPKLNISLMER